MVIGLATGAFLVGRALKEESGHTAAGPSLPGAGKTKTAPKPVGPGVLEEFLTANGFRCHESVIGQRRLHTCYRTEPDRAQVSVAMLLDQRDHVAVLGIRATDTGANGFPDRGSATEVYQTIVPELAERLLNRRAADFPSTEVATSRSLDPDWGRIELAPKPYGTAVIEIGDGSASDIHGAPLPSPSELRVRLRDVGFSCDQSGCDKGGLDKASDVTVAHDSTEISVRIEGVEKQLDSKTMIETYRAVAAAVLPDSAAGTLGEWLGTQLPPEHGFVQADVGGYHLEVFQQGSKAGLLRITAIQPF